jgi:small subunit ribosomal protein S6e
MFKFSHNFFIFWFMKGDDVRLVKFQVNFNDPETGKTFKAQITEAKAKSLVGVKIGDTVDGKLLGFAGYEFVITGGSDRDGTPMRPDVHGGGRNLVLLSNGPGFRPKRKGERRRKRVRGSMITEDTAQINMKIVKRGKKSLEEIMTSVEKVSATA